MGGLGKTELAVQYAKRHLADYPGGICWLNGQTGDLAAQLLSLATLALRLEVPQEAQGRPTTTAEQVQWCWRHWRPAGQVLVVLDDVATWEQCRPVVPQEPRFRVLVTTREQDLARQFPSIALNVLTPDQAIDLLGKLETFKRVAGDRPGAAMLCDLVGRLPLGIELVGRYLAGDRWLTLAEMATRLQHQGLQDPAYEKPLNAEMTAQYGIRAAFGLTWARLTPPLQRVARLLGYFALDAIPWAVAEAMMQQVEGADYTIRAAQRDLDNASLVEVKQESLAVCRLHPLIRQFVREQEAAVGEKTEDYSLRKAFTSYLLAIASDIPHNPPTAILREVEWAKPHLEELAAHWSARLEGDDLAWAFLGIARFYESQGLYLQAETWYKHCLTTTASLYADDHPTVACSLNNLASFYTEQGRLSEAEPLLVQALEMTQRLFADDHPDVALNLNNLAALYKFQGRLSEAEPLLVQALEMTQRLFADDHPDVALSLNNLASFYTEQGQLSEAEPLLVQALEMTQRLFADDDPDVATSLSNLAELYRAQSRLSEAEPLLVQALAMTQRLFTDDHSDIATSLNNLAYLYKFQGRLGEAEPLYQQALAMTQRLFAGDHPDVAGSLNNLAALYNAQGRLSKAKPLYHQALAMRQRLFTNDHPDVAQSLNSLAVFYCYQGRFPKAEPLLLQALEMRQRVLGDQHPDTVATRESLAYLRQQL